MPSTLLLTTVPAWSRCCGVTNTYRTRSPSLCMEGRSTGRTGEPTPWLKPTNGRDTMSQWCREQTHSLLISKCFIHLDNLRVRRPEKIRQAWFLLHNNLKYFYLPSQLQTHVRLMTERARVLICASSITTKPSRVLAHISWSLRKTSAPATVGTAHSQPSCPIRCSICSPLFSSSNLNTNSKTEFL